MQTCNYHENGVLEEELIKYQPQNLFQHSHSVALLATDLAEAIGCPPIEQDRIRAGSLLHDIGKQFIPASILEKQTKLSLAEFNRIQQHPWLGYVYLNSFTSDSIILNTVLYHHERWDGTGYPYGLVGEQIPLGARICALADVWDALVSDRCYRAAWTPAQTQDFIWARSGSVFDPQLAFQFLNMIDVYYRQDNPVASRKAKVLSMPGRETPALERIPIVDMRRGTASQ